MMERFGYGKMERKREAATVLGRFEWDRLAEV